MVSRKQLKDHAVDTVARQYQAGAFELTYEQAEREEAVDAATANLDQANARFGKGLGTAVELADAEALLTDSQIQLAVGRFQRARARARLARVIAEVLP